MFTSTLPYKTGRIHLTQGASDFPYCAKMPTHIPVGREDLPFLAEVLLRSICRNPIAIADLRRLIAQVGDARDLSRVIDSKFLEYVAQLLKSGYLKAVTCGLEAASSIATLSLERTRFHVGISLGSVVSCPDFQNHRVVALEDAAAARRFLATVLDSRETVMELRQVAFAQPELRELPRTSDDKAVLEALAPLIARGRLKLVACGSYARRFGGNAGAYAEGEENKRDARGRGSPQASRGDLTGTGAGKSSVSDAAPPEPPKAPEKTWFRARLLDEEGQPMAGEDYILITTDRAKRKGKLDSNGEVYIPPILPPGNCTISFPNIHLNPLKKK
jgi:hypothetical protein